ncbi:MAG: hypothetical protein ACPK85_15170 [Methanosarcina sp.]
MKQASGFFKKEQRAYTGLESAIMLATFVMVAAIFANTVLHTGITASTVPHSDKGSDKNVIDNESRDTSVCSQENGDIIYQTFSNEIESKEIKKLKPLVEFTGNNTSKKQNQTNYQSEK